MKRPITENKGMFSSENENWGTPQDLYDQENAKYQFTLDPCSDHDNHKCNKYYTKEDDGLQQDWSKERVFMNPPYGRVIKHWVKKAYEEAVKGALVVCLLPARTDTKWFHQYCKQGGITFLEGRLKFVLEGKDNPAPFPSMIVVFDYLLM